MSERQDEIYCLLVPLVQQRLVIPRSRVAEVIGYVTPAEPGEGPSWYLGIVNWNGRHVPLLSFEGCCGEKVPPPSGLARIVILDAVSPEAERGFFAVLSQGYPQLMRVAPAMLQPIAGPATPEGSPVLCQVSLLDETVIVPDLAGLEALVAGVPAPAQIVG